MAEERVPLFEEAPPRKGRPPKDETWQVRFLKHYAENGQKRRGARQAGVDWKEVEQYLLDNPKFAEDLAAAEAEFVEILEAELRKVGSGEAKGNAVAMIALLRKYLPDHYHPQVQQQSHTTTNNTLILADSKLAAEAEKILKGRWATRELGE